MSKKREDQHNLNEPPPEKNITERKYAEFEKLKQQYFLPTNVQRSDVLIGREIEEYDMNEPELDGN